MKMKVKVTKSAVRKGFCTVISVGYCEAQYLLNFEKPFGYSERAEGWACDYYNINGVCISTGYSPTGISVDYSVLSEYEKRACEIVNSNNLL